MILTGPEIATQVKKRRIILQPFSQAQVNPNSYNYRLGSHLITFQNDIIDPKHPLVSSHRIIGKDGFLLRPGRLYLAHTMEKIGSDHYTTNLIGRSSMGRLGLWLQVTADLGHVGAHHHWTLEMKVVQPLRVYAGMEIGQVTFWRNAGKITTRYEGKYAHDITAEPSHIRVEL